MTHLGGCDDFGFIWTDGTLTDYQYTNWAGGEPNDSVL